MIGLAIFIGAWLFFVVWGIKAIANSSEAEINELKYVSGRSFKKDKNGKWHIW